MGMGRKGMQVACPYIKTSIFSLGLCILVPNVRSKPRCSCSLFSLEQFCSCT